MAPLCLGIGLGIGLGLGLPRHRQRGSTALRNHWHAQKDGVIEEGLCKQAVAYFKRFYIKNSVMDYQPKDIMLTVLWLACKVEHYPSRFVNHEKVKLPSDHPKDFKFDSKDFSALGSQGAESITSEDLLRLELVLLKSLGQLTIVACSHACP